MGKIMKYGPGLLVGSFLITYASANALRRNAADHQSLKAELNSGFKNTKVEAERLVRISKDGAKNFTDQVKGLVNQYQQEIKPIQNELNKHINELQHKGDELQQELKRNNESAPG